VSNNYFLVDNIDDYRNLIKKQLSIKPPKIILTSSNFNFDEISKLKEDIIFFDDKINFLDLTDYTKKIDEIVWGWFIDKNGIDLSQINGFSFGFTLAPSIQILLNSYYRLIVGLRKILKEGDVLYVNDTCLPLIKISINSLNKEINFKVNYIYHTDELRLIKYGRVNIDLDGRIRDLIYLFAKKTFKFFIISTLLKLLTKNEYKKKKNIFFLDSGKFENIISFILKNEFKKQNISWTFQFTKKYFFLSLFNKNNNIIQLPYIQNKKYIIIEKIIKNLKSNLISKNLLINSLFDEYIFPTFDNLYEYYEEINKIFIKRKFDVVILGADNHEIYLLIAQAAKVNKIKTVFVPHGIYGTNVHRNHIGRFRVFDKNFSFSNKNSLEYIERGTIKNDIIQSSNPFFEKYINKKYAKKENYKIGLILFPDVQSDFLMYKINYYLNYLENTTRIFEELNIEVKGIKFRHQFYPETYFGNKNIIIINNKKYKIYFGYDNFQEVSEGVDICVGGLSTAILESMLMNIDYYYFEREGIYESNLHHHALYKVLNYSTNYDKLKNNIIQKKIFNPGFSKKDLIVFHHENKNKINYEFLKKFNDI